MCIYVWGSWHLMLLRLATRSPAGIGGLTKFLASSCFGRLIPSGLFTPGWMTIPDRLRPHTETSRPRKKQKKQAGPVRLQGQVVLEMASKKYVFRVDETHGYQKMYRFV